MRYEGHVVRIFGHGSLVDGNGRDVGACLVEESLRASWKKGEIKELGMGKIVIEVAIRTKGLTRVLFLRKWHEKPPAFLGCHQDIEQML